MNASDEVTNTPNGTELSQGLPAKPEDKAQWVKRFVESGLSLRAFSAQHGIGFMSLWRWVHKASKPAVAATEAATLGFTEIKLSPAMEPAPWVAEWRLPNGAVLRLSKEVPPAMLEVLLRLC